MTPLLAILLGATITFSGGGCTDCGTQMEPVAMSAYTIINALEENAFPPDNDLFVCNHQVVTASVEARARPGSKKVYYSTTSMIPEYGPSSAYYIGARAAAQALGESVVYWHSTAAHNTSDRIEWSAGVAWFVRPSAALGHAMAAYYLSAESAYFDGMFCDEAYGDIPTSYWTEWKKVHPSDNGGVSLLDADRPAYEILWDQMQAAFLGDVKADYGPAKLLIGNTAGATYSILDGIAIECGHFALHASGSDPLGYGWGTARFMEQKEKWLQSGTHYGWFPWNIAFSVPEAGPPCILDLQVPGLIMSGEIVN